MIRAGNVARRHRPEVIGLVIVLHMSWLGHHHTFSSIGGTGGYMDDLLAPALGLSGL